jgi:hypothetical protein
MAVVLDVGKIEGQTFNVSFGEWEKIPRLLGEAFEVDDPRSPPSEAGGLGNR